MTRSELLTDWLMIPAGKRLALKRTHEIGTGSRRSWFDGGLRPNSVEGDRQVVSTGSSTTCACDISREKSAETPTIARQNNAGTERVPERILADVSRLRCLSYEVASSLQRVWLQCRVKIASNHDDDVNRCRSVTMTLPRCTLFVVRLFLSDFRES